MTDQLGQSQVIPYLIGLSEKGYQIHIISAEKKQNYINFEFNIRQLLDNHNISWSFIKYTKKPPILSTIKDIHNLKKISKKLQQKISFDIVHCRSYISAIIGIYMKKRFGTKFIFDMRGFWADERVDAKIWNIKNPIFYLVYKYFKIKELSFLRNADYTISLTKVGKKFIHNNFCANIPIKVIPCCADLELFNYNSLNIIELLKIKKNLMIKENDFIISYLGTIGSWYMLDEMLDFFKIFSTKIENAKLMFITKDKQENIIKIVRQKAISEDKIIIQAAERKEVPFLLSLSKLSLFFIKPVFSKKASSPTKLAEILGMGIPVVCNSGVGDIDTFFEQENLGFLIKNFTNENYNLVVRQLTEIKKIKKERLRSFALQNFSLKIGIERYSEVYNKIFTI